MSEMFFCHSPSGVEYEIDLYLTARLKALGISYLQDEAGNLIAKITGKDSSRAIAITAHKDEIGAIVKKIRPDGKVEVRKLGGSFPWVYGEGIVDLLGDKQTVHGVLSFGSRHVSHESPQQVYEEDNALKWESVWIDTKLTQVELADAGIRPGTRMVIGKHRKAPFRLGDFIASYTLDNKASLAILLSLSERLKTPSVDVYLVMTSKEEVGAIGGMYFTQMHKLEAMIALEICPKSSEYPIDSDFKPVLVSQDAQGLYDEELNIRIHAAAIKIGVPLQFAVLSHFGSDASFAMKNGHVPRAACLAFPADNTHGYEIVHLEVLERCLAVLDEFCLSYA
jgi:putative aminopeptidase FrvX